MTEPLFVIANPGNMQHCPRLFPGKIMELVPNVPELHAVCENAQMASTYELFLEIAARGLAHAYDDIAEELGIPDGDMLQVRDWLERELAYHEDEELRFED